MSAKAHEARHADRSTAPVDRRPMNQSTQALGPQENKRLSQGGVPLQARGIHWFDYPP